MKSISQGFVKAFKEIEIFHYMFLDFNSLRFHLLGFNFSSYSLFILDCK